MWRQAFPYTMAFPPKQMEIHPLPCLLTFIISCHHGEELKSGFPPNWPKARRCCAAFPFPTAVPYCFHMAAILSHARLYFVGRRDQELVTVRNMTGEYRAGEEEICIGRKLDEFGLRPLKAFFPSSYLIAELLLLLSPLGIIILDYVRLETPLCKIPVQTPNPPSPYL